ncbi:fasciclin domain-containing protein [Kitasatospora sp. NPDC096147]|uniref:fasciclin domain-containing protein n=1 Tax=Kitasatospora sp. NPDC096147 TaxID=3364093 RepID=UPI00382C1EDA
MPRTPRPAALAALSLALLALAGCSGTDAVPGGGGQVVAAPPPPEDAYGQGCAALPAQGPGSLAAMAEVPVLTAIEQSGGLSRFAALIRTAKAKDLFDSMENVTVFAPDDAAFGRLTEDQNKALATQQGAGELVRRLVVVRDLRKADLRDREYASLQGAVLRATGSGEEYRIGGARVLCGSIGTANARLAVLDAVPAG